MSDNVNDFVSAPYVALTGVQNFYTIRTLLDIRPTGTASYSAGTGPNYTDVRTLDSQERLDKLVETISTRAQPIFLSGVVVTSESSPTDLPAASGTVNVYTIKFSVEHDQIWVVTGNNPTLAESFNGVLDFVNTSPSTNNNISVTLG